MSDILLQAQDDESFQENFPITPPFVKSDKRFFIQALYHFCRYLDDTVDDPEKSPEEKTKIIDQELADLTNNTAAHDTHLQILMVLMAKHQVSAEPLIRLIQGLKRDITHRQCLGWSDLYLSCQFTAAPIGELMLIAYQESTDLKDMAHRLCIAMQLVNHLQDMKKDYDTLGRVYLPLQWFKQCDADVAELSGHRSSPNLKMVQKIMRARINELLKSSKPLLKLIRNKELRRLVKMAYYLTRVLNMKLKGADMLRKRPRLNKFDYAVAAIRSAI